MGRVETVAVVAVLVVVAVVVQHHSPDRRE